MATMGDFVQRTYGEISFAMIDIKKSEDISGEVPLLMRVFCLRFKIFGWYKAMLHKRFIHPSVAAKYW